MLAEFIPEVGQRFDVTPGQKVPILAPFAHIGIELPNREDVDAAAARAKAVGWATALGPIDMAAHIGYVCFVDDPDGNTIEFSHKQTGVRDDPGAVGRQGDREARAAARLTVGRGPRPPPTCSSPVVTSSP